VNERITLDYHRPPDRTERFVQDLVFESDEVLITFLAHARLKRPLLIDGAIALEPDAPAVWFTFPGRMHDIGRFHTAAGRFIGIYANIMEPVRIQSRLNWQATDLFIDIWVGAGEAPRILDQDELAAAVASGAVSARTAARAQAEANRLLALHAAGGWPPPIVNEWPIERVLKDI
jgi:predicted RNA-binding protein associated with RNAse of E/G family